MKLKIDKKLLPMKAHYFLWYAGTAPVQPHMTVYAKQLGFSSQIVGTVWAILPALGIVASPVIGAFADKFKKQKFLFLLFQVLTTLAFFSIQFVPEVPTTFKTDLKCAEETYIDICIKDSDASGQCSLTEILEESKNSSNTIICQLTCNLKEEFKNEICNTWDLTEDFCNASSTEKSELKFGAFLPEKSIHNVSTNCIAAVLKSVRIFGNELVEPFCRDFASTNCKVNCDYTKFTQLLIEKNGAENEDVTNLYQFWLFFFLMAISWVGQALVVSIADAICYELLGADRAKDYGKQRLWGSVGWGIFAVTSGLILDAISQGQIKKNYTPAFYFMIVFLGFNIYSSYNLKYEQVKISTNFTKNIFKFMKDWRILFFMLWCLLMGLCSGIQWNFFFWYIEDLVKNENNCDSGSQLKTLEGILNAFQSIVGEIPAFFLSGWIIQKIGHVTAMTLVPLLISIRFFLYSVVTNPWWVLPVELFSATYGLFYSAMTSHASLVAPPGSKATVLGLVDASFGIGVSVGSYLGGLFFYDYGGAISFRIFGVAAFIMFVVHGIVQYFFYRNSSTYDMVEKDLESNDSHDS